jgi:predicted phosphodiesterase
MQITTVNGSVHNLDTHKISVVTGPTINDTDARYYIHGVAHHALIVTGDMDSFVTSLPNASSFAKLTAANKKDFWVNAALVTTVHSLNTNVAARNPNAKSALFLQHGGQHMLLDDADTVKAAVNAAGGNL